MENKNKSPEMNFIIKPNLKITYKDFPLLTFIY